MYDDGVELVRDLLFVVVRFFNQSFQLSDLFFDF
jgi:hypothetical protein